MIAEIEQAVAAYITSAFAALQTPCTAPVVPSMNGAMKPQAQSIVVVKCVNDPHLVGGMMDAEMQLMVESPAVEGVTIEGHVAIERALRATFPANNATTPAGLVSAVAVQVPGMVCSGYFFKGQQPGIEQTQWVPYYEVTIGLDPS